MPAFDGSGPIWGGGPGAGWGLGLCGASYGWRRGFGRTWMTREEESETLEEEAKTLEEDLKAIKERIAELRKVK